MEIVQNKSFDIIGISIRTTNENGDGARDIADLWQKFIREGILNLIPNKLDDTVYCLYTDYESDYQKSYSVMLGCFVSSLERVPDGMFGRSFEGGKYVRMSTKGNLSDGIIVSKWNEIWAMNLDRTYIVDFEIFGSNAQDPVNAQVDFMIGVR
ncbi:Bacterial transcription activator, effector binding domain [compost metagenome]